MNPDPDEHIHPGEEDLEWGQGVKDARKTQKPQPKYSAVGEQARKMVSPESLCKMFCGGRSCKYCSHNPWMKEQMAIDGLYSEWVTCNILAMARPSNENIRKFNQITQLQNVQVRTVVNLQQPGEHAFCGFGNDDSGFSYNPQTLMDAGMFFYNFTIQDYGVTGMSTLLDIVKVMQFAVSQGKVAVHCHAGLGRTGLIIACYLIYNNRVSTFEAIHYVRSRRKGAIQTKQQMKTCQQFQEYLKPFFVVFSKSHAFSFSQFLTRQKRVLHGYEARKLKHIPKIVYVCCERLLELCGKGSALSSLRNTVCASELEDLGNLLEASDSSSLEDHQTSTIPSSVAPCSPELLSLPTRELDVSHPAVDRTSLCVKHRQPQRDQTQNSNVMYTCEKLDNGEEDDDDDDCIVYGQTKAVSPSAEVAPSKNRATRLKEADASDLSRGSEALDLENPVSRVVISADSLWEEILQSDHPDSLLERLSSLEEDLNQTDKAWLELAREDNPVLVCAVMSDWFNQLSEPVLRAQDVGVLIDNCSVPSKAFLHLEKNTKFFLEYMLLVLSKFELSRPELQLSVLEFLLCQLCQKRLELGYLRACPSQDHLAELKPDTARPLFQLFRTLLDLEIKSAELVKGK